jgi:hypothetical protein
MSEQWREAPPGTGEFWIPVQRGAEQAPAQPTTAQQVPAQAQPTPDQAATPTMPAQRTGDADRPATQSGPTRPGRGGLPGKPETRGAPRGFRKAPTKP